ncbi:MAG: PQQ-dependent sugar dehydrogenase [Flavobacteriales bacterium]|nr:MAG: PQQ-dependent sugar dehydrogenase [Flavobacteriales bacterium]
MNLILYLIIFGISFSCAQSENPPKIEIGDESSIYLQKIVDGIDIPWGLSFTSNNSFLVTDKKGIMYHVLEGKKTIVNGVPEIILSRQGGLLDVAVDSNFNLNNIIYFTASVTESGTGSNTALYSAKFLNNKLSNLKLLYKASPDSNESRHYGGSILVTNDHIFFTIGDRGNRDVNPQNISLDGGKVYRLNKDGSVPDSNPFNNNINSKKAIWSYGHRNPQGIMKGLNSEEIWIHEHGPRGGDEINIIKNPIEGEDGLKDRNYGWPKATYGINYSGSEITKNQKMIDVIDPFYYWTPSIAPSGMAYIDSDIYKNWKNSILVGSLKFLYLERLEFNKNGVTKREKLFPGIGRVRDVNIGPDGHAYVSVEAIGIFKIIPK